MRIALAGNPNSGKTTMFNALTGLSERVGNWAGVTVEKKEHAIKKIYSGESELIAVDLPGAYSMSPFTSEESVTRDYINNENPDVIINIVDASNLSRSLFFTTQLLELGIPVVVALNKSDINKKKETRIDVELLSKALKCPVVSTVSTNNEGLKELISTAISRANESQIAPYRQGDIDLSSKDDVKRADIKRVWTATMADNDEDFRAFIDPVWKFYNETTDRVPMSDWFYTDKPEYCMFIARSVVGGYFIKLLDK